MIVVFQQAASPQTYGPSGLALAAIGVTLASLAITVFSSRAYDLLTRGTRKGGMHDLDARLKGLGRGYPVRHVEELNPDEMKELTSTLQEFLDTPLLPSVGHAKTRAAMDELLRTLEPFEEKPPGPDARI